MPCEDTGHRFVTIYGRNLVAELPRFVHRPYLVVTMEDLWPKFRDKLDEGLGHVHFVDSLDQEELTEAISALPQAGCVIGLGGGQALDVAKLVAWSRRLPLFQVPTAMSVNAAFGHRSAVRVGSTVRYVGWAVPEAVYVDIDVIQDAPARLNRSGVCDILCYHTAHEDWRLAHEAGRAEPQWPYDEALVAEARGVLDVVLTELDEIHDVTERGIRTLMTAHRWGGAAFHNAGWNPRHIEGCEHFFFYTLEAMTHRPFLHGQPVCLGLVIGSALQENGADEMLSAVHRAGVDIRPRAMGVTWDEVAEAMRRMATFVREAGLWHTVIDQRPVTEAFIRSIRERVTETFGE